MYETNRNNILIYLQVYHLLKILIEPYIDIENSIQILNMPIMRL